MGFTLSGGTMTLLGTLNGADSPATSTASGINDEGQVVGVGSWVNGGTRAFRTDSGGNLVQLGTLGGNISAATAINAAGEVVGYSTLASNVTHAFAYFDGTGMKDLGYLDYYHTSAALGINAAGDIVGTAQDINGGSHAVAWLAGGAIKDLAALIPPTSGWTIEAATSINAGGDIVGHGIIGGQEHGFLLQRYNGPDTQPPIAVATAQPLPYPNYATVSIAVKYWDNEKVVTASTQGAGTIYVTGPNGFTSPGTISSWTTLNSQTVNTTYNVPGPGGAWGPAANGTYQIYLAGGRVSDIAGNVTPGGLIGTFTIGFQTVPVLTIAGLPATTTTGTPVSLTISATASYPSAATDVFTYAIDWAGDGSDVQTVSGQTNTVVQHTYTLNGSKTVSVYCTDPHGVQSAVSTASLTVSLAPTQLPAASVLSTQVSGIAIGSAVAAVNGSTMYFFGQPGTTDSATAYTWSYLVSGAQFTSAGTVGSVATFAGAGVDSRNRVIIFGGSNSDGAVASARSYPSAGSVAALPVAITSAVTTMDNLGRIYVYSPSNGTFFRYTAGNTGAGAWETLPSPPSVVGAMSWDGGDRIIIFGATPAAYSISGNGWTQTLAAPSAFTRSVLGADGLVYLVSAFKLLAFDPVLNSIAQIGTTTYDQSSSIVLAGTDGFIYLIGASGLYIERFDTRSSAVTAPYISSTPAATTLVQSTPAASPWTYSVAVSGKPRPTFALDSGPAGMAIDPVMGIVTWTPTPAQLGVQSAIVRATNSVGTVAQQITLTVRSSIYADTTPPTGPTNVVISNLTSTSVDISWDPGTDDVGVTGYILYKKTVVHSPKGSGSTTYYTAIGSTSGTSLHLSGLTPNTSYPYYLVSVDAAGNKSGYVAAGFMTTYMSSPGITNGNNGLAAGTYAVVGQPFTSYTFAGSGLPAPTLAVVSAPAGAVWNSPAGTTGNFTWTPATGQEGPATFSLSATNSSGTFTQSYTVQVYPAGTDLAAPTTPGGFLIDQVGWNSCRATWTASTDNVGVAGYRIIATHLDSRLHAPPYNDQVVSTDVAPSVLQAAIIGLLPSTAYDITVQAFDAAGNLSAPAASSNVTLPQPFAAFPAFATNAIANTGGGTTLTWPGSGYYWGYTVEGSPDLVTWTPVAPATQWPNYSTSFSFMPDPNLPRFFYHVRATPTAAP